MIWHDDGLLIVTDLKQVAYCPRISFYEHCLPHVRPRTFKMDAGRDEHQREQKRAARRTLHAYDLAEGERRFNVRLHSEQLGLVGEIDEVVYAQTGEVFPVDYKLAKRVSLCIAFHDIIKCELSGGLQAGEACQPELQTAACRLCAAAGRA